MFSFLSSKVILNPVVFIILLVILIARKKKKDNNWETDILHNSFNSEEEPIEYNNYSNKDQLITNDYFSYDLKMYFDNERIEFSKNIIFMNNRYYLSIQDLKEAVGFTIEEYSNKTDVYYNNRKITISFENNSYKSDIEKCFRVPSIKYNNLYYISLIDLVETFNLKVVWSYEAKEINLYRNRDELAKQSRQQLNKPALIRLEDITAGSDYTTSEDLHKLRIVADLMYLRELPFHIAWIPRYKKPQAGIDNDLLTIFNMYNADFIYTLDYLINRGGIIGLHGYTHQYGDGESVEASEFGDEGNADIEFAENRVKLAIEAAEKLNIPYSFFESPHYSITEAQQAAIEGNFNYIFEPAQGVWNDKPYLSKRNNKTVYVPAPWGYVQEKDVESLLGKIRSKSKDSLGALFYHPYKEFEFIHLSNSGYPDYKYSDESMLKEILKCLEKEGYSLVRITDIRLDK
jgi:hypothetical protein